jgi:hypothetical protein
MLMARILHRAMSVVPKNSAFHSAHYAAGHPAYPSVTP